MADSDACDLIEEWARGALEAASLDVPDGVEVRASADGGDGYTLTVEVPSGEGAQQLATSLQSVLGSAARDDPTLGGRFEELSAEPVGADLVASGDRGPRSSLQFTPVVSEESDEADETDGADEAGSDEPDGAEADESDDEGDAPDEDDGDADRDKSDSND